MRTLFIVVAVLLLGWLWLRRRAAARNNEAQPDRQERRQLESSSAYHAVAIKSAVYACDAAKALEGKRFLATDAPRLPLPECPRDACECRFQHYDDRRSGRDRRSPFASGGMASTTGTHEQERRHGDDRRSED